MKLALFFFHGMPYMAQVDTVVTMHNWSHLSLYKQTNFEDRSWVNSKPVGLNLDGAETRKSDFCFY